MASFGFLNGSFNVRSPSFDRQRLVNGYIEPSESGTSRSPAVLYGTPGLLAWLTLSTGRIRGMIRFNDNLAVVVAGTGVWTVTSAKVATQIGTIVNESATVSMASNGTTVMMVDGPRGCFIDPILNTVTPITTDAFVGADRVDFIDGYYVWNDPGTGKFQISGLYATTIDPLDFATAEGGPDNIVSLIADHRELWLFGQNTSEVWINAGDVDFPFQRIQGAFQEVGCAAPASVAKGDNAIYWLTRDDRGTLTLAYSVGYQWKRAENSSAFEYHVAKYGDVSDAVAFTYAQEGHTFYVISFPSANGGIGASWGFDMRTRLWHERAWRTANGGLGRHRANCQMVFAGLNLVGDWETGKIYSLDLDTFTDDGNILPLIRSAPHITNDVKRVLFQALELTMQTGVGLATGQGDDPQAMLRWSDDGGYNWSNETWASFGRIGATKTRVRWTRLGMSRDRIFEVTITDPVRRVITGADLQTVACAT